MKKILFASTALIASAGIAAADVSVGGDGRMGVIYVSDPNAAGVALGGLAGGEKFRFTSRIRITFRASGTTDSGMTFGGSVRSEQNGAAGQQGNVFISGEFGRIMMGDVSGAPEFVNGDLHGVGLTGLNDYNEFTYLSNGDRPAMRYDYSMDAFTFAISADNPANGAETYGIGVAYDAGMFGVALGYETNNDATQPYKNHLIASATASVDGVADFKIMYGRGSSGTAGSRDQYGISASSSFDQTTVTAFARRDELTAGGVNRRDSFGIGASYDLGGGAALRGGVVRVKSSQQDSVTLADFGVSMSF